MSARLLIAALLASGCVPTAYVAPSDDPADPGGEASSLPTVATALTEDPAPLRAASGAHGHHGHDMAAMPGMNMGAASDSASDSDSDASSDSGTGTRTGTEGSSSNPHAGHGQ